MDKFKLRKMIKETIENEQAGTGSFRLMLEAGETIDPSEFDVDGKVRSMIDGSCYISSGIPEDDFSFFKFLMLKPTEYAQMFSKDTGPLQFYFGGDVYVSSDFKLTSIIIRYLKCKSKQDQKLNKFRVKLHSFNEGYNLLENMPPNVFSKIDFQKEVTEAQQKKAPTTSKKFNKILTQYAFNNDLVKKFMTASYRAKNRTQIDTGLVDLHYRNLEETYFINTFSKLENCNLEELHDLLISLGFTTEDDYTTASPFVYEHDSGLKFEFYTHATSAGKNLDKIVDVMTDPKVIKDPKRAIEIIIEIAKFYDMGI